MKQPPKVLLKYLEVSIEHGYPVSIDFAVLAGTMAALLGEKDSAAHVLAEYAAGLSVPAEGKIVTGIKMDPASSREGKSSTGFVSSVITAPPGMTVRGCISLAVTGYGKTRNEAAKTTDELLDWLELQPLSTMPVEKLDYSEKQRTSLAIAMATNPKLLVVECPVHDSIHAKLKEFSQVGNAVLFSASSLGQIPYGVERIALCDIHGINRTVRHSELAAMSLGGSEISISFYPSIARKQLENIEGIKNLVHVNGFYKLSHANTIHAITQLMLMARANSRAVVELKLSPIPPSALLKMFNSIDIDEIPSPADLFHGEEGF